MTKKNNAAKVQENSEEEQVAAGKLRAEVARKSDTSTFSLFLEEAWEGWARPVMVILLALIVGVLYYLGFITEWVVALALGSALGVLPLVVASVQAMSQVKSSNQGVVVWVSNGVLALVTILSVGGATVSGPLLFKGQLSEAHPDGLLTGSSSGSVEVTVSGHIEIMGAAGYDLTLVSPSDTQHIKGEVKKENTTAKIGRRRVSGVVREEGSRRFSEHLAAPPTKIHLEKLDNALNHLNVEVHRGWLPIMPLMILGVLALLVAVFLDGRLASKAGQTYLSIAAAFTLTFAYVFFDDATPGELVANAIGAAMMAGIGGTIAGMVLSSISKGLFGPKTASSVKRPGQG